ncbi:Mycolic acid cyclopropane synthetase-domain-containing protein [Entophlyctis helioformis]|nr:Mycolic acid cyclopropane synthetase-domain-containing protein [Entophlyctis helioformis]
MADLSTPPAASTASPVAAAESACLSLLGKLRIGQLTVVTSKGVSHVFGKKDSDFAATITVRNDGFWIRLMFLSAMGLGEGYMLGDIDVDRIDVLLMILLQNRDYIADGNKVLPAGITTFLNSNLFPHIPNSIYNSRSNISAHYDLGNDMFASFLDPTMTYSCPIWESEKDTLEEAQIRKIHRLLDMANIREGDHVLEIGTGWGALSMEAVRRHNCKVTTITLSSEQQILAQGRIAAAGLSDKITVLLTDYRTLDPAVYCFDRIISVEMLEAVGPEFLATYFETCDKLVHPTHGVVVAQVITMPEARYSSYLTSMDFIRKHIFPGGHCPSLTALIEAINQGTQGRLMMDVVDNIGPHYAKALRLWREDFIANFDDVVAKSSDKEKAIYDEVFKRKWEYYFAYCEVGFASRTLGDLQFRATRVANSQLVDGIPL